MTFILDITTLVYNMINRVATAIIAWTTTAAGDVASNGVTTLTEAATSRGVGAPSVKNAATLGKILEQLRQ